MSDVQSVQVLDGDGKFYAQDLSAFISENGIAASKTNYQVVAIVGPQSSGKSTLLNHVFGTSFVMMDAMMGRSQTTKGVWLAKSPKVSEPSTIIMDLEGNDGRERGEDDTNYERQIALFALSVADTLIINIWCHDIGREHGAGKPIIKTILQVNLKLFAPDPNRKKTVILFVIRDKSRTPQGKLEEVLLADMDKIWQSISKPPQYEHNALTDFFEVRFAALSHYEEKYEDFVADTNLLRRRFSEGDLMVGSGAGRLPADAMPMSMQQIWEVIKSQKDLNLPAHKVMVANVRCNQIKEEQIDSLQRDAAWQALASRAAEEAVPGFGTTAASLLDSCIEGYEMEAMYFDPSVRSTVRGEMELKLQDLVKPSFDAQVSLLQQAKTTRVEQQLREAAAQQPGSFAQAARSAVADALQAFVAEYERDVHVPGAPWGHGPVLAALEGALAAAVAQVVDEKAAEALDQVEKLHTRRLASSTSALLDSMPPGIWAKLQKLAADTEREASAALRSELAGFELSEAKVAALQEHVAATCQQRVTSLCREAACTRLSRMKDRFHESFSLDRNKTPRTWGVKEDIPLVARQARHEAARVLAHLCVLRLDPAADKVGEEVERAVLSLVGEGDADPSATSRSPQSGTAAASIDMQSVASWPEVAEDDTLLQPTDVRTTWREFMSASNNIVQQALMTQQANRAAARKAPPLWAIVLIILFGMNEALALLYSPVYLVLALVAFLFARTLYMEMDVEGEMQKGALPGLINLASKLRPSLREVTSKTWDASLSFVQSSLAPETHGATSSSGAGSSVELASTSFSTSAKSPDSATVVEDKKSK